MTDQTSKQCRRLGFRGDRDLRGALLVFLSIVLTSVVYWPGLSGPFLFDDYSNITAVNQWQAGEQGLLMTLLPNGASVVYSRPVAMATFAVSAWLGSGDAFAYKLGNLLIHLLCGCVVFHAVRLIFSADRSIRPHATLIAGLVSAAWLLHPLHASTVLYVVQRMAQLSTLFALLAVIVYFIGRRHLASNRTRSAGWLLFCVFPLTVITGLLSKQNAATAPLMCLVLELAYFYDAREHRRVVLGFFGAFAILPCVAVVGILTLSPQSLLSGYADWGFTLGERLLTQPRAIVDYIRLTLLPDAPTMGIYTDDFPISKSLLNPPQTILAILLLSAVTLFAIANRKRAPALFAGWGIFLVAHSVESTFLPLEMYYEHRNYLPSVGLLMALVGLLTMFADRHRLQPERLRRIAFLGGSGILLVLAFATFGRALVWQTEESIVAQAVAQHPRSMRAMLDQGVVHIKRQEYDAAVAVTLPLRQSEDRRQRVIGRLQRLAVQCMKGGDVDTAEMERAVDEALPEVTVFELQMARLIVLATPTGSCGDHSTLFLADGITAILEAASGQTHAGSPQDATRMIAAQLYARGGDWREAERQAELAWKAQAHLPAGALLVRIYVHNRERDKALQVIAQLESKARSFDTVSQAQIALLRSLVDQRLDSEIGRVNRPAGSNTPARRDGNG